MASISASLTSSLWIWDLSVKGLATARDQTPSWSGLKSGGWRSLLDEASRSLISLLERTVLSCKFCIVPVSGYVLQAPLAPSTSIYGI